MLKIEEAFERGIVYCLVRKCTHTKIPVVSERAEKMIWPSEYRSMADAWELSGEEGRDKLATLSEVNHLSNSGTEIKRDSPSSGERTGRSPNHISGVVGPHTKFRENFFIGEASGKERHRA